MLTVRLAVEASFRPSIDKLLHSAMKGKGDIGIILYFTVANLVSEIFAEVALLIVLFKRHKIWLERLNLFPLGLPDGVIPPK